MRSVRDFGAAGDGTTDDTEAIQHAVDSGAAHLYFPPGDYLVSKTIKLVEAGAGRTALTGAGGTAKVIMAGPGPAFRIRGSHRGTASPVSVKPTVWANERLPTIQNLEIEGRHEEADGILCEMTMQSTFEGVLLRKLRHGIHFKSRNRNVLVSHCHIYENSGVGIFFDGVNAHQVIIASSHISYCAQSGIKILQGDDVRNVQITGNDIEYNYSRDAGEEAPPSAEIWIEASDGRASTRECTIASNTIQSRYSPGGANIMLRGQGGDRERGIGMATITGNLIGSQETNVFIEGCDGVTLGNNFIYSGHKRNLHVRGSRRVLVNGCCFDHNANYLPDYLATGITFEASSDCTLNGAVIRDAEAGEHTVETPAAPIERDGLVECIDCERMTIANCQVTDSGAAGLHLKDCSHVNITGCTIVDTRAETRMPFAIQWAGPGSMNRISNCILAEGTQGTARLDEAAGVHLD